MSKSCGKAKDSPLSGQEAMVMVHGLWKKVSQRTQPKVIMIVFLFYFCFMYIEMGNDVHKRFGLQKQKKIKPQSREDSILLAEFNSRKKRVKQTCEKHGAFTSKEKLKAKLKLDPGPEMSPTVETDDQLWGHLKKTSHHQFFVQKEHGLMWCKVPKAASTSLLYAYLQLAHVPSHQIPEDNGLGLHGFLREKYPILSKNLFRQFVQNSIKFFISRHPFERILSAYADKLESYARDLKYRGGYYYAMYGADIVEKYRPKYQEKFPKNPLFMRKEPSFVEFVEYLVETPVDKYDEHWKPIFLLCPPCHFNFDVIVKMETFTRDTDFILSQRNLQDVISLRRKHSAKNQLDLSYYFSQLSKNMINALYQKYRIDFEMFEYDVDKYIKFGSESKELMPDVIEVKEKLTMPGDEQEEEEEDEDNTTSFREEDSS